TFTMLKHLRTLAALIVMTSLALSACGTPTTPAPQATATSAPAPTVAPTATTGSATGEVVIAEPGQATQMVLMPKFLGIAVFDQAHEGALEAHAELKNPEELQFLGPTAENSAQGQIEILTTSTTQGVDAIMISNNAGDQLAPAAQAARDAGMT